MMTGAECIALCRSCAASLYGNTPPTPAYAENVARLLAGTAATESLLIHNRQIGLSWDTNRGAWGLWQTEAAPLLDSARWAGRREALKKRATVWLFEEESAEWPWTGSHSLGVLLRFIARDPRLACLWARLHYMRFPEPIPSSDAARAEYYKRYYNTTAGSGSPEKYLRDYEALIVPWL